MMTEIERIKLKRETRKYIDIIVKDEAYCRHVCHIAQSASQSDVSTGSQKVLKHLDQIRKNAQSAIYESGKKAGSICAECGVCCCVKNENESRYLSIDFWLRRYTDEIAPNQDEIQVEHPMMVLPRSIYRTILREISDPLGNMYYLIRIIRIMHEKIGDRRNNKIDMGRKKTGYNPVPKKWIPCMYLGDTGCTIDPSDRPIICIIHTCYDFRRVLDVDSLKSIAKCTSTLRDVCNHALNLLKKEGKLNYLSDMIRLTVPLLPFGTPNIKHIKRIF